MKVAFEEFPFYTTGITSWVDVDDVVKLSFLLMDNKISGERFIISAGNFSFKEIFTLMAHSLRKKPPHIKAGAFITGLGWRLQMLQNKLLGTKTLITKETVNTAHGTALYNNQKLSTAFPSFTYQPIGKTIDKMAQSFIISFNKK